MGHRVVVVQKPPVLLDLEASLELAVNTIAETAVEGAELVVFPESFLAGYPAWTWYLRPDNDAAILKEAHARLAACAIDLDGSALQPLAEAAATHGVTVVCGLHERDPRGGSTLFNTVVVIGPDGGVLNRHSKLVPTGPERTVWGRGDGSGLRVVDTPVGRLGGLICWENYMPLARFSLYAQGIELYVAPTWDYGDAWLATMRHIAREAGCWVIGCGAAMQARDVPGDFPGRDVVFPDDDAWLCWGDSVVVSPRGDFVAGPLRRERGLLWADVDTTQVTTARRSLDVAGHYNRPDIFRLEVDRTAAAPVSFLDQPESSTRGRSRRR